MHVGAGLALAGTALFYESLPLLTYTAVFLLVTHVFVVLYEEPAVRRTFANQYEAYCAGRAMVAARAKLALAPPRNRRFQRRRN
jgi:protein-S-isoprenylcysteine O-methyltransferase Ste14